MRIRTSRGAALEGLIATGAAIPRESETEAEVGNALREWHGAAIFTMDLIDRALARGDVEGALSVAYNCRDVQARLLDRVERAIDAAGLARPTLWDRIDTAGVALLLRWSPVALAMVGGGLVGWAAAGPDSLHPAHAGAWLAVVAGAARVVASRLA